MVLNTHFGIALAIAFYIVIPIIIMFIIKNKKTLFYIATALLGLFVIALVLLTLFDVSVTSEVVTINAHFDGAWCNKTIHLSLLYGGIRDVIINSIMLAPIGSYVVIYNYCFDKKHGLIKALLVGLIVGFSIEALQFILPVSRSVQLRDMLLNAFSATLGAALYILLIKLRNIILKTK